MRLAATLLTLATSACDVAPTSPDRAADQVVPGAPASSTEAANTQSPTTQVIAPRPPIVAERLILAEWSRAENRASCVPLGFASDGGKAGSPRRALFSGGWAVAFDLPGKRSAYGLAGTGSLPDDSESETAKRTRLIDQWPSFVDLAGLPQPAYAGYGVEGASPWPDGDPQALKENALAYVRVAGQSCQYNVWSRLGRAHLELLLRNLRVIGRVAG